MPAYRYRTEGVPAKAVGACTPVPTVNPIASSWGLVKVVGAPGTLQIPVGRPASTRGDIGLLNEAAKPSSQSPDYILPSLYYTTPTPQMVIRESTNEIPIPAISTSQPYAPYSTTPTYAPAVPAVAQRGRKIGGRRIIPWPKVNVTWPVIGQSNNAAPNG